MEVLENEAHRLVRSQPHMARTVQAKQTDIIENWEQLNDKFDERLVRSISESTNTGIPIGSIGKASNFYFVRHYQAFGV